MRLEGKVVSKCISVSAIDFIPPRVSRLSLSEMLIEYNDKPLLDIACKKVQRSLRRRKVALLRVSSERK